MTEKDETRIERLPDPAWLVDSPTKAGISIALAFPIGAFVMLISMRLSGVYLWVFIAVWVLSMAYLPIYELLAVRGNNA